MISYKEFRRAMEAQKMYSWCVKEQPNVSMLQPCQTMCYLVLGEFMLFKLLHGFKSVLAGFEDILAQAVSEWWLVPGVLWRPFLIPLFCFCFILQSVL